MMREDKMPPQTHIEILIQDLLASLVPPDLLENDPNFGDTPRRVAEALINTWMSGYWQDPEDSLTVFENVSGEHDLVLVKDLPFYSTCAHHMAPFFGKAAVAYIANQKVVGLSKMKRLVDVYARRFQLQERITQQVADSFMNLVQPQGVMVVLYGVEHLCMTSRGIEAHGSSTTTSAVRGVFDQDFALRTEALGFIRNGGR